MADIVDTDRTGELLLWLWSSMFSGKQKQEEEQEDREVVGPSGRSEVRHSEWVRLGGAVRVVFTASKCWQPRQHVGLALNIPLCSPTILAVTHVVASRPPSLELRSFKCEREVVKRDERGTAKKLPPC